MPPDQVERCLASRDVLGSGRQSTKMVRGAVMLLLLLPVISSAPGRAQSGPQAITAAGGKPTLTLSPGSLTFSRQFVGTTSSARTVNVTNAGKSQVTGIAVEVSGNFSQMNTCSRNLASGASCTISVRFAPATFGTRAGAVMLTYNTGTQTLSLSGLGYTLASIAVTPANSSIQAGGTQQFTATAGYTDGVTQDLTASATWSSSVSSVATINATGLATGMGLGQTTIAARSGSISGSTVLGVTAARTLTSIAVTPANPSIQLGATQQFTAIGTYTDGGTQDLTRSIIWFSFDQKIAPIDAAGLATGVRQGQTTVAATSGSISGFALLTVTPGAPTSVTVTPANPSIETGGTQQFTAVGVFADGTMQDLTGSVTWASSIMSVATITTAGLATSLSQGQTTITATSGSISSSTLLKVRTLSSITVTPGNPSVQARSTQQFTATGNYADGTTGDITALAAWISSDVTVATISATGLATGAAQGQTTITASSGSISGSTLLTVTPAEHFIPTGNLNTARYGHTATLLGDGKVLIAGGADNNGYSTTAEVYDPETGIFSPTGNLTAARYGHTATLLNDGTVLIAGGYVPPPPNLCKPPDICPPPTPSALATAELYDPATGTFSSTGGLTVARYEHTATLLSDGGVLIAGGAGPSGFVLSNAEVYDPAHESFAITGNLNMARGYHTATLLNIGTDGKPGNNAVLIAGGLDNTDGPPNGELYDPMLRTFLLTGNENPSYFHTATLLGDGSVLIAGGRGSFGLINNADLYNAGGFLPGGSLNTPRWAHTATLLNNGTVLIAGGSGNNGATNSAELYDPATQFFQPSGNSLITARWEHTATLLKNGRVLIAGGHGEDSSPLASAELY